MKKAIVLGLVAVALGSSCTVVAPGNPDGGAPDRSVSDLSRCLPPPKPLEASC